MSYEAKVIADSISVEGGHRLTTLQVTFPRIILAEFNTHRVLSRNSASSRAVPVEKRIASVESDPFVPAAFGKNRAGMQSGDDLVEEDQEKARTIWSEFTDQAVRLARLLSQVGVHKQWSNRLTEASSWHTVVVSSTEWSNYDALRDHPAAAPEIQTITRLMKQARENSLPRVAHEGYWHLPYVRVDGAIIPEDETAAKELQDRTGEPWMKTLRRVSVGRCASVSFNRQEEKNFEKDLDRYLKLRDSGHMSPFEHPARPMTTMEYWHLFCQKELVWNETKEQWDWKGGSTHYLGNFQGWIQERKLIRNEHDFGKLLV